MDCGEILMQYNKKKKEEKSLEDLKKNVKLLKRKRDALEERENRLRVDINSGRGKWRCPGKMAGRVGIIG